MRKRVLPTPYDVPAEALISRLAGYFRANVNEVTPPKWADIVKTGSHVKKPPIDPDWWFIRCASILRKIYLNGPIGIMRLRAVYGGRVDRGAKPEHVRKSGGAIIRNSIHQLEDAGLVETIDKKGRIVTRDGRRLLDKISTEIKVELEKELPDLQRY
jgi:small subunit ribosomal protein S19e